jgi:radical SAM protein with 4Fe4S-binding SPASM domain
LEFFYIKKALDDAMHIGLKAALITGGEPLLRKDLKKIFKCIKKNKLKLFLATNSLLINNSNIKFIKSFVDKINISLDGSPEIHDQIRGKFGAFKTVEKRLILLKLKKIPISISFTVHDKNYKELPFVMQFCIKNKFPLNIKRFINLGRGKKNKIGLSKENYLYVMKFVKNNKNRLKISFKDPYSSVCFLNNYGCYAGVHILSIKNNGDVWICTKVNYPIGNIKKKSLIEIWNTSKILKKLRDRDNLKGRCGKCHNKLICGGCRAAAYAKYKDLFAEDPICSS